MSRAQTYDLRQGTFRAGWRDFLAGVRYQQPNKDYGCHQCALLALCGQCPGWGCLEHGEPENPVEFLCRLAHLRADALELDLPARPDDLQALGMQLITA